MARAILTLHTLASLLISLAIAAAIAVALTRPGLAQTIPLGAQSDRSAVYLAQCLQDREQGTHLTKREWSRACQRVVRERGNILPKQAR